MPPPKRKRVKRRIDVTDSYKQSRPTNWLLSVSYRTIVDPHRAHANVLTALHPTVWLTRMLFFGDKVPLPDPVLHQAWPIDSANMGALSAQLPSYDARLAVLATLVHVRERYTDDNPCP